MGWFRDLFKSCQHCWHTIRDPGYGQFSGNTRKCCACSREEELVSGPLKGHGPGITDPDNQVWRQVEYWGW